MHTMNQSTQTVFQNSWDFALEKITRNIGLFDDTTPHYTQNGTWRTLPINRTGEFKGEKWDHGNWTGGFWSGILWLAYKRTGDELFRKEARIVADKLSFRKSDENTHDLGFLFVPSHILGYRLEGDNSLRDSALLAARTLMKRFSQPAGLLQAWGPIAHKILGGSSAIDTMMNLPLLWWAAEESGEEGFHNIAYAHAISSANEYIREDNSTWHVLFFDRESGKIVRKTTFQGLGDDSCWSRGQSWGIAGWTLAAKHTSLKVFIQSADKVLDYYWQHLPDDLIPFWDFDDPKIPEAPRDTSAAAIAAYGILELSEIHPDRSTREDYYQRAIRTLMSLSENYISNRKPEEQGILLHASYSVPHNQGVDNSVIWGDYFYLLALTLVLEKN